MRKASRATTHRALVSKRSGGDRGRRTATLCSRRRPVAVGGRVVTNARGLLVACTVGAALVGALGLAFDRLEVAAGGLIASTAFFGAFAVFLIVNERRRHESAEDELQAQASFLESLVDSIAAVSSTLDADEILERTRDEAKRLFEAREAHFITGDLSPDGDPGGL